jgi:hypothetical protein
MIAVRYLAFSVVRSTDFVSHSCQPSDESLGYFQSSAKRGLGRNTFCKARQEQQCGAVDLLLPVIYDELRKLGATLPRRVGENSAIHEWFYQLTNESTGALD